jgi:hypothetical protein
MERPSKVRLTQGILRDKITSGQRCEFVAFGALHCSSLPHLSALLPPSAMTEFLLRSGGVSLGRFFALPPSG